MAEEDAAGGVDSESGRVVTVSSILVKIVVQIAMSGNDIRLSISLLVWSNSGEQDESGFAETRKSREPFLDLQDPCRYYPGTGLRNRDLSEWQQWRSRVRARAAFPDTRC